MSFIDSKADEALGRMRGLQKNTDYEVAHAEADDVLCDLLREMGFNELVDSYEQVGKWYA